MLRYIKNNSFYILTLLLLIWCIGPLVWLLIISFAHNDLSSTSFVLMNFDILNYLKLFEERDFFFIIRNSFIVALITTILSLSIATLTAYALTRKNVRFGKLFLFIFLSVSMFPSIATLSPLYMIFRTLGLRDSILSLIIPYTVFCLPISIWILAGYFKQIPKELEESAKIDGCSDFKIFWNIFLPLLSPGLATAAILIFVYCWNEFIFAISFTATKMSRTIPPDISLFPTGSGYVMGDLAAASIITSIPLVLIVLFFQRKIISGLTSGAVKE
ncbi:MAG: carbohydrate ABC transporter permease [Cyanobacteriota bacterium]